MRKIIIFLVLISLIGLALLGKEIFLEQTKRLVREKLEKNFPGQFSIGAIRTGLLYGLVLEELKIHLAQSSGIAFDIKVDEASVDYNAHTLRLLSPDIRISYAHSSALPDTIPNKAILHESGGSSACPGEETGLFDGEFELILENGQISFGNNTPVFKELEGKLLLSRNCLSFQEICAAFRNNPNDRLRLYGELNEEHLALTTSMEHLKIGEFDILTNFALKVDREITFPENAPKILGTLTSYGSVINKQPFPELKSSFEVTDSQLHILSCNLDKNYDLRGIINLSPPFDTDLCLNLENAELNELIFKIKYADDSSVEPIFSGLLTGLIEISGNFPRPQVKGYLEAKQGHIGVLEFINATINLQGRYPKIDIVDSRICREEDYFIMEGGIDFAAVEKFNVQVKADKAMFWQGWDITRNGDSQVHMSKNVDDDLKVTFDTYDDNYENELGLEYKISGDKAIKFKLKREEEMVGVERRVKF